MDKEFFYYFGFLSGILIILYYLLNMHYKHLANTMLGTMLILANGGNSTSFIPQSRMFWQDKDKVGEVIATGFDLRRNFSIIGLIVSLFIVTYSLYKNEAHGKFEIMIKG